ncbi:MAG: ATP-dependent DNA helicase RecG [Flavobacteriia bacterium]|nr:ATP-dependent DNA helicase RecG [Flavobacteriia bacterium]OJX34989.1 MAG: ATP-dependent DNA helicase RecG [Flavobacteriia bacterium 40-80]
MSQRNIQFIRGVGPTKALLINEQLNCLTVNDLLLYVPFRYVDRSVINKLSEVSDVNLYYQFSGKILSVSEFVFGRKKGLQAMFSDGTGTLKLVWYQKTDWIVQKIKIGTPVVIFGKLSFQKKEMQMAHPEVIFSAEKVPDSLVGVYSSTEQLGKAGLNSSGISKLIKSILEDPSVQYSETLPRSIREKYRLLNYREAIYNIHFPENEKMLAQAQRTLKFEELFYLQLELLLTKQINLQKIKSFVFEKKKDLLTDFYTNYLPFELTNAQKRVVKEINRDLHTGNQMNRLVQGDVGSGKTLVALLSMLLAVDSGFQTALMAPTEILAQQHFLAFRELLKELPVRVELLIGSLKNKEKLELIESVNSGVVDIVIGTHALIEERVKFDNLGMVVIDEQHRFGVAQRSRFWKKNILPPHILVMTATPIPRTLAMTVYGDLDVSVIDELPPGRKPITTKHFFEKDRLKILGFLKSEIMKGRQVYIVYPLIEESESLDFSNLMEGFEYLCHYFPKPDYQISMVHGKLKPEVKDFEMNRFIKGETQIMVATTVIEVGVNVPNASVMVIESAERFGLSQLHQLRGRVGRGAEQSYCLLVTKDRLSQESKKRMTTMVSTGDGFKIAEVDLELRGPGDLMGTQQSGLMNFKVANLMTDIAILEVARNEVKLLLEEDPMLHNPENQLVKQEINRRLKNKPNWSQIS